MSVVDSGEGTSECPKTVSRKRPHEHRYARTFSAEKLVHHFLPVWWLIPATNRSFAFLMPVQTRIKIVPAIRLHEHIVVHFSRSWWLSRSHSIRGKRSKSRRLHGCAGSVHRFVYLCWWAMMRERVNADRPRGLQTSLALSLLFSPVMWFCDRKNKGTTSCTIPHVKRKRYSGHLYSFECLRRIGSKSVW